jgi:hypothetical protein
MYELIAPAACSCRERSARDRRDQPPIATRSPCAPHTGCGGEMQATRAARRATSLLTATPAEVALDTARAVPNASGLARLTLACRRLWVKYVAAPTTSSGGAAALCGSPGRPRRGGTPSAMRRPHPTAPQRPPRVGAGSPSSAGSPHLRAMWQTTQQSAWEFPPCHFCKT